MGWHYTPDDIDAWSERGRLEGASHLLVVCDTFSYEDYPVFVKADEDLSEVRRKYSGRDMQMVHETVTL